MCYPEVVKVPNSMEIVGLLNMSQGVPTTFDRILVQTFHFAMDYF